MRLVMESERVVKARARSEKDVRNFLKTGLAAEHHRVGQLLNDFFSPAMALDWSSQILRRTPSSLPPLAMANNGLPVAERLRFKQYSPDKSESLELLPQDGQLSDMDDDFWASFDALNQTALFNQTIELLSAQSGDMSIADIANHLPPSHDLEAISLWLSMAMASDTIISNKTESFDIITEALNIKTEESGKDIKLVNKVVRFTTPVVALNQTAVKDMDFEI